MTISSRQQHYPLCYNANPAMLVIPEDALTKPKPPILYEENDDESSSCSTTYCHSTNSCTDADPSWDKKNNKNLSRSTTNEENDTESNKNGSHNKPAVVEKHVSFDSVEIRWYEVILGDHPCCSTGCPMSLGWNYDTAPPETVTTTSTTAPQEPEASNTPETTATPAPSRPTRVATPIDEYESRRAGCRRSTNDLRLTWIERRNRIQWHTQRQPPHSYYPPQRQLRRSSRVMYFTSKQNPYSAEVPADSAATYLECEMRRAWRNQQQNRDHCALEAEQQVFF